ncbi:MAG: hypothetical protein KBT34_13670, partial [Prevotella sp.]|nr:hypothetical protein [Candidatus Prevotella equi]
IKSPYNKTITYLRFSAETLLIYPISAGYRCFLLRFPAETATFLYISADYPNYFCIFAAELTLQKALT